MLLILSAQFVGDDIALQFGQLPPSFLPLGNQRLFSVQSEIALGEPCFITVPEDFKIPETDIQRIFQDRYKHNIRLKRDRAWTCNRKKNNETA